MDVPSTHSSGDTPRVYHSVTLNSNGLRCCLISDPTSDKAAAAVCVMAGQLQDTLHGIAHLTEHMLFMGSTAFPGENEYDQYIQQAGGHSNAYTDLEQTVFYFDVSALTKFRGGLERLCGALSDPIIATTSLERELQAVDAEHSKNVTQDHWRTHQLTRTLLGGAKDHPYSSFGTGNKTSLLHQTKATPTGTTTTATTTTTDTAKASGDASKTSSEADADVDTTTTTTQAYQTLRDAILTFYKQHYCASNMTLAVLGPQSVSELHTMVEEIFVQLPSSSSTNGTDDDATATTTTATTTTMSPLNTVPRLPVRDQATVVQWVPLSGGDNSASLELQWIVDDNTDITTTTTTINNENVWLPQWYRYQSKPAHVWSHLLGHEGPGSLLAALRDLQWAQDLSADDSSGNTRSFSLFTLHVSLTVLGLQHVVDVLHMIYYYINVVLGAGQDIPDWVYDELQVTGDTSFRFLARRDAAMTVSSLAAHMHQYQPEHYLSGAYRIFKHDVPASQHVGASTLAWVTDQQPLSGNNPLILLGSTEYAGTTDAVDPWYGTHYRIVPNEAADGIWSQLSERWTARVKNVTVPAWTSALFLPAQNDMLPSDFGLVTASENAGTVLEPWTTSPPMDDAVPTTELSPENVLPLTPRCLIDTATCRLWYKPDLTYQTPKANFIAAFRSPVLQNSFGSPETAVLSSLWVHVATELCNEFAYAASMAGLHCGFSESANGSIELSVSGYNHKTGILLQRICDTLATALPVALANSNKGDQFFERIRNKVEQQYESALASAPYTHGSMVADLVLEASNRGSIHQRLSYLTTPNLLSSRDLLHFSNQLLSYFHLEVLVHGNVLPDTAKEWGNKILNTFKPSPVSRLLPMRGVQLPAVGGDEHTNECIYRLKGWNENDENSCVVNIYQVGLVDIPTNATMSVLLQLLREPAFNILRTEEQLGYIVFTGLKTTAGNVKSINFLIQSDSFDPVHVDVRIESFLNVFRTNVMMEMTDEDFQANVDSFCDSILEKDKNLGEESSKHWNVINNQTYQFHRLHQIARAARRLTKVDILRFFDHFLLAKSPFRRKLSVQMFGTACEEKRMEMLNKTSQMTTIDASLIQCPDEFVRAQALFPAQSVGSFKDLLLAMDEATDDLAN